MSPTRCISQASATALVVMARLRTAQVGAGAGDGPRGRARTGAGAGVGGRGGAGVERGGGRGRGLGEGGGRGRGRGGGGGGGGGGGAERREVRERRSVQEQLDGTGAGARGHLLPGDRGDRAVAGGVPQGGGREGEHGGGDDGERPHALTSDIRMTPLFVDRAMKRMNTCRQTPVNQERNPGPRRMACPHRPRSPRLWVTSWPTVTPRCYPSRYDDEGRSPLQIPLCHRLPVS